MSNASFLSIHYHLYILIIVFLLLLPSNGNSQDTDPERTILFKLKEHWSNPPSLSHWNPSLNHCSWPEITCTGGSVTGLDLIDKNITQTLPPFICDLKNLTLVNLTFNLIPGPFPTVLYNCSKLEYLDLSQNCFIGSIPDDIDRISPRLKYLNLQANNFTGDIPTAIGRLREVRTLLLVYNLFNGSFPPEMGNLQNLEVLELSVNGFVPSTIPSSFTRLMKLKRLLMFDTKLVGEIPEGIGNLTALEYLDLSQNGLSGYIPSGLFLLKNLTVMYLHKNRLSGSIPQYVESPNLEVIDLSANNLTGEIPEGFGKLTKLTYLALFFNQLSGKVPSSIGRLPALQNFTLFSNNLSGELPQDFGKYSVLMEFQVASNKFGGTLPEHLCAGGSLRGVVAFDNDLTGVLPNSLGKCSSLSVVRVHGNRLHGEIPDGLWTSENLTMMMISHNSFSGQLPRKVAQILSRIEINNNQFSGEIPLEMSSWTNLEVFKASNNVLTGTIPRELTALEKMSILLLDGNQLSGNLPSNIISWRSLATLNLSRNRLAGQLPAQIGHLPNLLVLDLSENEFSGQIPPEIGLLRLTLLNLSSNHLTGRIPGQFENAVFDNSFRNNPDLCASNPSLGLNSCYLKAKNSGKLSSQFVAAVASIAAMLFVLAVFFTLYVIRNYRRGKSELDSSWKLTSFQKLNFTESNILSRLTENYVIGSGGSGKVYCVAIDQSGEHVAVKRIWDNKKSDDKIDKEFLAEVEILSKIRHANIVKLLCCISSDNSKLLVYEYLENRSLDIWLHGKKRSQSLSGSVRRVVLDWPKRMQIAVGAAQGLCYMHHHCLPPIIHRDLKSSNILLDSEFNAKIADFGLATMLAKQGEPNTMSVVVGSFGYIAPEYARTRRVNEKIDVYSFGVILLELVTGKEANNGDENTSLAEWALRWIQEGNSVEDVFHEDVKEPYYLGEMSDVFKLGLFCTVAMPSARPSMKEVLQILLRCSQLSPSGEKIIGGERDAAPLLDYSRRETRTLEHENGSYTSHLIKISGC